LDHAGATIYSKSLIEKFSEMMLSNLYGNPHSESHPAKLSGHVVDSVREKALRFLGADPEHFDLVFTANTTSAIKLVAESFRDLGLANSATKNFWYGYHKDSHTSLVGIREYADGSSHCFSSDKEVEDWLEGRQLPETLSKSSGALGLFAYPGQSNMTGRRLPLSWTRQLRRSYQDTYSLLDAAALATSAQLDFSDPESAPDFTALAFYKIFGFPDLGGLIVRKKSGHILSWRRYFGGGTINGLTVLDEATFQRKDATIHDGLEDGTLPFHSIMALGCAIDEHKRLYGSMKTISQHTSFLIQRLYAGLSRLSYPDGRPLCVIYHDNVPEGKPYSDPTTQGATIAFSVVQSDGTYIRHSVIEQMANDKGIYLRAGGLCNPGGTATYLKIKPWQYKRAWSAGYRCGDSGPLEIINGKPLGVVRASLGAMSTMDDVDSLINFLFGAFLATTDQTSLQALLQTLKRDPFQVQEETSRNDMYQPIMQKTMKGPVQPIVGPLKKDATVTKVNDPKDSVRAIVGPLGKDATITKVNDLKDSVRAIVGPPKKDATITKANDLKATIQTIVGPPKRDATITNLDDLKCFSPSAETHTGKESIIPLRYQGGVLSAAAHDHSNQPPSSIYLHLKEGQRPSIIIQRPANPTPDEHRQIEDVKRALQARLGTPTPMSSAEAHAARALNRKESRSSKISEGRKGAIRRTEGFLAFSKNEMMLM
jgi:molybdenum cofactor sulfurtransferase